MQSKSLTVFLITVMIGGLFAQSLVGSNADDTAFAWDVPASIRPTPKPKQNRSRPPARVKLAKAGVEKAPLLALNYKIFKRGDGNREVLADPKETLQTGEQVRLAVTTNQTGFLYIIGRTVDASGAIVDPPRLIFPDPRINGGRNSVSRGLLSKVPANCPDMDDPKDCWWELVPPVGREIFNVIFSRDEITSLPKPGEVVDQAKLNEIEASSEKSLIKGSKVGTASGQTLKDGTFVQNPNPRDNEEIFATVELTHVASEGGDAAEQLTPRSMFIKNRADGAQVSILKDGSPIDVEQVFSEADELKVKVRSNFNGYVYFLNVEPGGKRCVIFPCASTTAHGIQAGVSTLLPRDPQVIGFDSNAGTEIFQVVISPDPIKFLEDVMARKNCCDDAHPCGCELSGSAATAAAELASASKQKQGSIAVDQIAAALPKEDAGGPRSRGVKLAAGKDRVKVGSGNQVSGEAFVAVQDQEGQRLKPGQAMVFEVRLTHK